MLFMSFFYSHLLFVFMCFHFMDLNPLPKQWLHWRYCLYYRFRGWKQTRQEQLVWNTITVVQRKHVTKIVFTKNKFEIGLQWSISKDLVASSPFLSACASPGSGGAGGGMPGGGGGGGGGASDTPSPILPVSEPDVPSWKLESAVSAFRVFSDVSGRPSGVAIGVWYWEPAGSKPFVGVPSIHNPASFWAASAAIKQGAW